MAIAIKNIPILTDKSARKFVKNADNAANSRGTVDFTKQLQIAQDILAKAAGNKK